MRVAIRRIRSVLRACREMFPEDTVTDLNVELRWLARMLGEVRDADVYGESFEAYCQSLPEAEARALGPYAGHVSAAAQEARATLIDALSGKRYAGLLAALERFVRAGPSKPVRRRFRKVKISRARRKYLDPAVARTLKRGRVIRDDSSDRKLHKLRIEGKRLRYMLEFFGSVQPKRLKKQLRAAKRFQDELGEHQDAITARAKVAAFAEAMPLSEDSRATLLALGGLLKHEALRRVEGRAKFPKAWKRFEKRLAGF